MVALSTQHKGLAIVDARRDIHLQPHRFAHTAHALALVARGLDDLAGTAAAAAGLHALHHAERGTLLHPHLSTAVAVRASLGRGSFGGSGAAAVLTLNQAGEVDLLLATLGRLHEGERDVDVNVVAADRRVRVAGSARAAKTAKAAAAAKKAVEDIADVAKVKAEAACTASAAAIARIDACVAKLVIARALLRVGEHRIGFVDLFKFGFCVLVPRIQVRVVLFGKLAVSLFQFVVAAALLHAEHFIIISFFLCQMVHPL